jgi:putative ABC transport system substrate-binding protein
MRRRDFVSIMGLGAAAWPLTLRAEQPNNALIGVLLATRADDPLSKGFVAGFDKAVHKQGSASSRNLKIEYRFGLGDTDLTPGN